MDGEHLARSGAGTASERLPRSEQRLRLALGAGRLGVWEWDHSSGEVTWDRALETIFGLPPDSFGGTFDAYVDLLHPDDRDQVLETVQDAFAAGKHFRVEHRIVRPDGSVRWVRGDGQPLLDGDRIVGLIGVSVDVTDAREAEAERERLLATEAAARAEAEAARARLAFLGEATALMGETLELDERLRRFCRLCVPRFADAAAVYLRDGGAIRLVAVHHRDPAQLALVEDLARAYPPDVSDAVGVGAVLREGRTQWMAEIADSVLLLAARSDEHLARLRALRLSAGASIPLRSKVQALGVAQFIATDGRRMSADDVALAEELCDRVAVHIDNGRLLEARAQEQAAHRHRATLLQALFDASIDGMLAVGDDGRVLAHNQRLLNLLGVDPELVASADETLLPAATAKFADPSGFLGGVRAAYRHRRAIHDEVVLADGRVLDRHGTAVIAEDGTYVGYAWTFRDVTVERAQQAAIAAEGRRSALLARTLQQSLLPPTLPTAAGLDFGAAYHAGSKGVDVGGDFYDVFAVGDDWVLVVGDVCGKGPEAAATTALVRYTVRNAAIHHRDPASMLAELNTAMVTHAQPDDAGDRFATVVCARLRRTFSGPVADVACGGHPSPLILRSDGAVETAQCAGPLLGVFPRVRLTTRTFRLYPGDRLVAFTDGVLEARNPAGELLGADRLARVLEAATGQSSRDVAAAVGSAALAFGAGRARDDIAVLVAGVIDHDRDRR